MVLPNACKTILDVSFDLRNLMHFMNERLCSKAQWEIRELAEKMRDCVLEVEPDLKELRSEIPLALDGGMNDF